MDEAQALLQRQNHSLNGLQSVGVFEGGLVGAAVHTPDHPFLQILNTGAHWVCISTLGCRQGHLVVYDSLVTPGTRLSLDTQCQVAWMTFGRHTSLDVQFANVHRMAGNSDCGVFAIAYAVDLACGNDPTACSYDQRSMRPHLLSCLRKGSMVPFPSKPRKPRSSFLSNQEIPLTCECHTPAAKLRKDFLLTVSCFTCRQLFHKSCVTVNQAGKFLCSVCSY